MALTGFFKTKCAECGEKEIYTYNPDAVGFCSRMCETNHEYRRNRMDPLTGVVESAEEVRSYGAKRDLPKLSKKD